MSGEWRRRKGTARKTSGHSSSRAARRRRLQVELLEDRRLLAEYVVDCLADDPQAGCLTLRAAIAESNVTPGPDTIRFDPSLAGGTIRMARSSVPFLVADDVTITGLGRDQLAIDGDVNGDVPQGGLGDSRLFLVDAGVTLTMSAIRLQNGYASEGTDGGAISSDGSLVLTDVTIRDSYSVNDGGAIYASSESPSVSLTGCTLENNVAQQRGGGVVQLGDSLVVDQTEVLDNTAEYGGGIYSRISLQLIGGSLVQGNSATWGGGLYGSGQFVIDSSTLKANSATETGGGFWVNGRLEVRESLVTQNEARDGGGGYARNDHPAVLLDSQFTENYARRFGGAWYSHWYRPVQVQRCTFADNHADVDGGAARGVDSAEISDTQFLRNTADNAGGAISSWGTLQIVASTFEANEAKWGGALSTWGVNTIEASTFSGNQAVHGGAINHTANRITIVRSHFEANTATGVAGAIRHGSPGVFLNSTFRRNTAGGNGGVIEMFGDEYGTKIVDCLLEENSSGADASGRGGAIWTAQRRVEVAGTVIQDNSAGELGGGIFVSEGFLALTDGLIAGNQSRAGRGGGMFVRLFGELAVANTTISGNTAHLSGGGVYLEHLGNPAAMVNTTIANNLADVTGSTGQLGGGIYTISPTLLLQNTIVAGNFRGTGGTPSEIQGTVDLASAHNLVWDSLSSGGLQDGVNSNIVGYDPRLGPLQDNGGRSRTHALLPDSPAVDSGDNALALAPDGEPLWNDQRGYGFDRLVGLHVDRGAFELQQDGGQLHGRKWFDLDQDGQPDEAWGVSIVTNGGFEDGSYGTGPWDLLRANSAAMPGWSVFRSIDWIGPYFNGAEGSRCVELDDDGAIAQTLVTQPGRRYRVQFAMAGNPDVAGVKTLRVSAAGEQAEFSFDTTGHTTADMGWETKTWEFVAQDARTLLVFESSTANSGYGPALDNVVVQPFGRDDVRIYLDQNANQVFDAGEPLTFLRPDDPNTPEIDETGRYRFTGLPDGPYSVRELLGDGYVQVAPDPPGSWDVTITAGPSIQGLDFGNRWDGRIRGTKFIDWNNNGIRDRNPLPASSPTVLMVVDASYSTSRSAGFTVPDVNGDGVANWVLDAELLAMLTLRQELVDLGWGSSAQVGIVVFGSQAVQMDMDPAAAGIQLFAPPAADTDGDGVSDVEQVLRSIQRGHAGTTPGVTDFESALVSALQTLQAQSPAGDTSLFFVSDGLSNSPWSFEDEVEQLDAMGVDRVAWAFGDKADVADLRRLDPFAEHVTRMDQLIERVTARSRFGAGDGRWLEPGLEGVTIYLDDNGNEQLDWTDGDGDGEWDPGEGERWRLSRSDDPGTPDEDETGWYAFDELPIGRYTVREIVPAGYEQTAPLSPDEYRVDLRSGPVAAGYDFGNRPLPGGIAGRKGLDADDDGVFEADEPGQAGVTIYLDLNRDGILNRDEQGAPLEPTAVTDREGRFTFGNLEPGEYVVREIVPAGFEQILPSNGEGILVEVPPGETASGGLFVNADLRGCISGWKWIDLDGDWQHDPGEPGLAGATIYLDENDNGRRDAGEPWTVSQEDDPATPDVDETGDWKLEDVVPGEYIVREDSPHGFEPGFPGPDGHPIVLPPRGVITGLLFGNIPIPPFFDGWKYDDCNRNGRRDPNRLGGPLLVLTVDLSASVQNDFAGDPPGDVNGDGLVDTVLDGELAALIEVNQALIDYGLAASIQVAIVAFGEDAAARDMDPAAAGIQLATSPAADADGDGMVDVEQVLRSLQRKDETDYAAALTEVDETIDAIGTPYDGASMLFVSDGEPNSLDYEDEVALLRGKGVTLSAFGAGRDATLYTLRMIDPLAERFTSPANLVWQFFGSGAVLPAFWIGNPPSGPVPVWLEPGVSGVTIYLDDNDNRQLDWVDADGDGVWDAGEGERWTVTQADDPATPGVDENGYYRFEGLEPGTYIVREVVPDGAVWIPPKLPHDDVSLVARLPFDGEAIDVISGTAADNSGATLDLDRFGLPGNAYFFDGAHWMTMELASLPRDAAPRTFSTWVKSADGAMDNAIDLIAGWGTASALEVYGVALYRRDEWYAYLNSAYWSSGIRADREWHHLALTYDGTSLALYVDGNQRFEREVPIATGPGPLVIGTDPSFSMNYTFDGTVDDLRVHDRPFGKAEIADLYAWEASRKVVDEGYVVRLEYGDELSNLDFGNNDSRAGFTIESSPGILSEAGTTETFSVVLDEQPAHTVKIPVRNTAPSEAKVEPDRLTFTPDDWDTRQTVTVTSLDDDYDDGDRMFPVRLEPAESWDLNYAGLDPPDQPFVNEDDDTNGFAVTPTGGTVTETGDGFALTVTLNARPLNDVVLTFSSADEDQVRVNPPELTFRNEDTWNLPRTVTVSGVNEPVVDGDRPVPVTAAVDDSRSHNGWDPLPDQVVEVLAEDDEVPGIVVTITGDDTTVSETGTTDSFKVALTRQPLSTVVLTLSSGDTGESVVAPQTLVFGPLDWYRTQTVTALGVDDPWADGPQTTQVTVSVDDDSSNPHWQDVPDRLVPVVTADDEVAALSLSLADTEISEFGGSTIGTVTRNTELLPELPVTLLSSDASAATVPGSLTIPAGQRDAEFPIDAVDDDRLDGTQTAVIGAAAAGLVPAEAGLVVTDYEPLSISVSVSEFSEAHGPQAARLEISRHNTELGSRILASLHSDDTSACTLPETVEIPAGQSTAEVWLAAVDDWVDDGPQTVQITASAAGFLAPSPIVVTVTDHESHQSPSHRCDLNRDWKITPVDVLVGINAINLFQAQILPVPPVHPFVPPPFVDATGDGALTAEDPLAVISDINLNGSRAVPREVQAGPQPLPAEGEPVAAAVPGPLPAASGGALLRIAPRTQVARSRPIDRVFASRWHVPRAEQDDRIGESLRLLGAADAHEERDLLSVLWSDLDWLPEGWEFPAGDK